MPDQVAMDWPAGIFSPADRLALANIMAAQMALDTEVRKTAAELVRRCSDVAGQLPELAARYVRERYLYLLDPAGMELFQGPRMLEEVGGGDCDCLAMKWVAIVRATGLYAWVGGEILNGRMGHAIGIGPDGRLWELSDTHRYGPPTELRYRPPAGARILTYRPEPWHRDFVWVVPKQAREEMPTNRRDLPWVWIALGVGCMIFSRV